MKRIFKFHQIKRENEKAGINGSPCSCYCSCPAFRPRPSCPACPSAWSFWQPQTPSWDFWIFTFFFFTKSQNSFFNRGHINWSCLWSNRLNVLRLLISSLPFRVFLHSMKIIKRIVYVFMARTHSLKKH